MREGVPRQRSQQAMFDLIDFLIQPSCQSVEVCFLDAERPRRHHRTINPSNFLEYDSSLVDLWLARILSSHCHGGAP